MNRRRFLILVGLGLILPALAEERATSPNFKGSELYSWRDGETWLYALLPGTNRNKTWSEVKSTPLNLEELKSCLKLLAVGELISWGHQAQEAPPHTLQLSPHWEEIEALCQVHQLQIFIQGRPK